VFARTGGPPGAREFIATANAPENARRRQGAMAQGRRPAQIQRSKLAITWTSLRRTCVTYMSLPPQSRTKLRSTDEIDKSSPGVSRAVLQLNKLYQYSWHGTKGKFPSTALSERQKTVYMSHPHACDA
jgi:hypothetical protein